MMMTAKKTDSACTTIMLVMPWRFRLVIAMLIQFLQIDEKMMILLRCLTEMKVNERPVEWGD